jgi:hypothetical protein
MPELSWHDFAFRPSQIEDTISAIQSATVDDASRISRALSIVHLLLDGILDGGRHGISGRKLTVSQLAHDLADHTSTAVNARCRLLIRMAARIATEFYFCIDEV